MRRLASVAVCLALAACAQGPLESDWQQAQQAKDWHEEQVALPPYPKQASKLVRFDAGRDSGFRFFVDTATLSVGADGVVRYVLIARSARGAENVSFEGLRCKNDEYKVYATGGQDRRWVEARGARWRPLAQRAGVWRKALANDYFCPGKSPIANAAEGIEALERGGNPRANIVRNQPGG